MASADPAAEEIIVVTAPTPTREGASALPAKSSSADIADNGPSSVADSSKLSTSASAAAAAAAEERSSGVALSAATDVAAAAEVDVEFEVVVVEELVLAACVTSMPEEMLQRRSLIAVAGLSRPGLSACANRSASSYTTATIRAGKLPPKFSCSFNSAISAKHVLIRGRGVREREGEGREEVIQHVTHRDAPSRQVCTLGCVQGDDKLLDYKLLPLRLASN